VKENRNSCHEKSAVTKFYIIEYQPCPVGNFAHKNEPTVKCYKVFWIPNIPQISANVVYDFEMKEWIKELPPVGFINIRSHRRERWLPLWNLSYTLVNSSPLERFNISLNTSRFLRIEFVLCIAKKNIQNDRHGKSVVTKFYIVEYQD
jgi:hypothetical protein